MYIKISPEGKADLPEQVLKDLGVGPGDQLAIEKTEDGFVLRPRRIDLSLLGYLRDKIPPDVEPFDIHRFREQAYDPKLRN